MDDILKDQAAEYDVREEDKIEEEPGAACSNQTLPVIPHDQEVWHTAFNGILAIEFAVQHLDAEDEDL